MAKPLVQPFVFLKTLFEKLLFLKRLMLTLALCS